MENIFKISDLKKNKSKSTSAIVIPEWILEVILNLCNLDIEWCGYLVCRDNIVEFVFLTGSGETTSVVPDKKIVFNNSSCYTAIEFHTHPTKLGNYWTDKFSSGDTNTFNKRITQEGEQYNHILFTVNNILTWGKEIAPDIRIGFGQTDMVKEKFNEWNLKHPSWANIT